MPLRDTVRPVTQPLAQSAFIAAHRARGRRFVFEVETHRYFFHRYNETWRNERCVEIPLARAVLRGRTLELGNVLAHYGYGGHVVVDKYEQAPGVHSVDIVDFVPEGTFDTIVSISTVEHIGFDEDVRDEGKPRRAIARLRSFLAPGGELFVTFPLGYNPGVDVMAAPGATDFDTVGYLKRGPRGSIWEQAGWDDVRDCVYDTERAATALAVCTARG